jgi:hypothetical protein
MWQMGIIMLLALPFLNLQPSSRWLRLLASGWALSLLLAVRWPASYPALRREHSFTARMRVVFEQKLYCATSR